MEFKLKFGDVLNLNQTLKLIIDDNETKVEPLFKFKLLGIMKSIENYVNNFELIRNEKIMEYGTKTDDGNIQVPKDDAEAFQKFKDDLNQIINSDVTVNIETLKASDVFDKGVKADYLVGLYPIIDQSGH